ncbi:MAG: NAD-dependent dehydratase, partial [Gemmatimonadetes bacterium]|nr:NAD-dependent dehydratase [Gemmatimonadota bacterium]
MKVLFIGGTGTISTACTRLAAERGIELYLLNRGQRQVEIPNGVQV